MSKSNSIIDQRPITQTHPYRVMRDGDPEPVAWFSKYVTAEATAAFRSKGGERHWVAVAGVGGEGVRWSVSDEVPKTALAALEAPHVE